MELKPLKRSGVLLIIGFKRLQNIENIASTAITSGIKEIVIFLDGIKGETSKDKSERDFVTQSIADMSAREGVVVEIVSSKTNNGCAVNVILAVNHTLKKHRHCAILEDDCLPSETFFTFYRESIRILDSRADVWLGCGSQFAPLEVTQGKSCLSLYALTWGWFTTRKKWDEILPCLIGQEVCNDFPASISETRYWKAGRRRALEGFTDVWDTILVAAMRAKGKRALLPANCLVSNVGNDEFATHTKGDSPWLNQPIGLYRGNVEISNDSREIDLWIRKNVYRISSKHIVSTLITQFFDFLGVNKRKFSLPLEKRILKKI